MSSELEAIVIEPKGPATAAVIWLHGLGDSGEGFAPVVPVLGLPQDHQIRFIFPHAPEQAVTLNDGYIMRAWYDIKSADLHNRADLDGVMASERLINALINEQIASGISSERIVLGGFSQGGLMSLFTGMRCEHTLAGIMALSCYLPGGDALPAQLHAANRHTPILQNHGLHDDVVPLSAALLVKEALTAAGYALQWQTYPMAHSVLPNQLQDIGRWLLTRLSA
ncbi:MAG: alpha/beta hydrolase [Enterovibrio sp.]